MRQHQNSASNQGGVYDQCQTPPYALDPLLLHVPEYWNIWEPACGEGYLVSKLVSSGIDVLATDLKMGQNFLTSTSVPVDCDCILTNPPFSKKLAFLEHCYRLGKPFSLLMQFNTASSEGFWKIVNQPDRGIHILVVTPRISFKMPNLGWYGKGAHFSTAWFCHLFPYLPHGEISRAKISLKAKTAYHTQALAQQLSESPLAPNSMTWEDYAKSLRKKNY